MSKKAVASKKRPTMRELAAVKHSDRLAAMEVEVAEGRLTVRQMTPKERKASDIHHAAGAEAREARAKRNRSRWNTT